MFQVDSDENIFTSEIIEISTPDIVTNNEGLKGYEFKELDLLVNNFSYTNTLTDWTFGTNTFANGIVSLTGTAPNISSKTFTVGANDIVVFQFTLSLPTPSTTTSGPGLYLGTKWGQSVYVHGWNASTKTWNKSTSLNTNPYFLYNYNSKEVITIRTYILGSMVNLNEVPPGESTRNVSFQCIQLTGSDTTTSIRSGYNSNTSMVINFSDPTIYKLDNHDKVKLSKNYVFANQFVEV